MRDWRQILVDIRSTMLEYPSHALMAGLPKKTSTVFNNVGAEAIDQALAQFDQTSTGAKELQALADRRLVSLEESERDKVALFMENKKLHKEIQTLKDTLEAWQAVVRVAREKDSTLPDPEAAPC